MENKIIMYTDGGARNNPGPAGIGVWIETLDKKYSKYIGEKTNNDAEYEALIFGLKQLKKDLGKKKSKDSQIHCFLDSELAVKQLNHEYKLKEERIQGYFIEIWNLMLDFKSVEFEHVLREKNKVADSLANEAMDAELRQGSLL
jgi:ribonuclease HI